MAAVTNKQRLVNQLFTSLGKSLKGEPPARPVLEQFLYALCREGTTRDSADRAYSLLQERFYDWNEIRVSSPREIADVLEGLVPEPEVRAQRIVSFLQEVFETTFSFDLESLIKKGLKQAAKTLSRYQAANDYAVASVVQQSMGGHALPLDAGTLRALRRLGMVEDRDNDVEAIRASLEHQVPKAKGGLFIDALSVLAEDHCFEVDPRCNRCPLLTACPTGQEVKAAVATTSKKPR